MIQRKNKIVLFLPHRADPTRGEAFSADLLPLELLQIASGPVADGYEVVMIDAMIEPDYMRKIDEACEGALLFASSCILGYQVYDGLAMEGAEWFRAALKKISAWRLRTGNYGFPLEHKLFHLYVKLTHQTKDDVLTDESLDRTPGVTPSAPA